MKEKLDVRQTVLIGTVFLSICAFWQMYNNVVPLILTNTFHLNETWSGVIMAADNVLGIFLLPLYGDLSDKTRTRIGRRKPFIMAGTAASIVLMLLLPLLDDSYFTARATWKLVFFVAALGGLLIAMSSYRSPAVALMPDMTPKAFRSRGNAIINLMGACGGILYLIFATLLYGKSRTEGLAHVSYLLLFGIVACIMLLALIVLMTTVQEPTGDEIKAREAVDTRETKDKAQEPSGDTPDAALPADVKKSLLFLLFSVALWYISYNAIETWFTTYAVSLWNMSLGDASMCLTVGLAGAILTYIPAGMLTARIGRKKSILIGVGCLFVCFVSIFLFTCFSETFHVGVYVLFAFVGVGWALINVNSFPMVVEMCRHSDIGKFTGIYYTFSMVAQTVTPILAGFLMRHISYRIMFPYAAFFAAVAFVTMMLVRHGDGYERGKKGLEAFEEMDMQ